MPLVWELCEMCDNERLVTIAEFGYDMDAHLARIALEAAGIKAVVMGDTLLAAMPEFGMPKIELKAKMSDAERAREILAQQEPQDSGKDDE